MKIIKPRDPARVWLGRCRKCNAEAEAVESEMTNITSDPREGWRFSWEKCPECGAGAGGWGQCWGGMLFHETTP